MLVGWPGDIRHSISFTSETIELRLENIDYGSA